MKKAQLQVMETTFVLITLIIIVVIVILYTISIQAVNQTKKLNEYRQLELIKRVKILDNMAELKCSTKMNCFDLYKVQAAVNTFQSYDDYLGYMFLKLTEYNPETNAWTNEYVIYDNTRGQSYIETRYPVLIQDVEGYHYGILSLGMYS